MTNDKLLYAIQDNEQTFTDQYVYEVGVIGCVAYHSRVGNGIARMTQPINKHKKTWWIAEVARESCVEFRGRRRDVIWCETWDEFIDKYLAWFKEFQPSYLFAHSFANDHGFWKRTQTHFGTRRRMNHLTSLDGMFRINEWKTCQKICTQYLFDKGLSPKFCNNLVRGCSFSYTNTSKLQNLMKWYHADPMWRQSHTSNGDAMDLFRLVRLRMMVDGTRMPNHRTMLDHLKTTTIK